MNDLLSGPRALIDVRAVAERLSVAEKTVRRFIDSGKLPGVIRLGAKLIRIDPVVLDKWVSEGCPTLHRFKATQRIAEHS